MLLDVQVLLNVVITKARCVHTYSICLKNGFSYVFNQNKQAKKQRYGGL